MKDNSETVTDVVKPSYFLGRSIYAVSLAVLLVAISTLLVFYYWAIQSTNVLTIKDNPVPVERKIVKSGDVQIVNFNFCKNLNIEGSVEWSLVSNKIVILLPSYKDRSPKSCRQNARKPIILPLITNTDDAYHFHYVITYRINPIKTIMVQFDTQSFKIDGGSNGK